MLAAILFGQTLRTTAGRVWRKDGGAFRWLRPSRDEVGIRSSQTCPGFRFALSRLQRLLRAITGVRVGKRPGTGRCPPAGDADKR